MGNQCNSYAYCCGNDEVEKIGSFYGQNEQQKPFSQANLFELTVQDEKQLKKLEELIKQGVASSELSKEICQSTDKALKLLKKKDKSREEYENLCLKDGELQFKAMEFGSLKYMGQVRLTARNGSAGSNIKAQQGNDDSSLGRSQDGEYVKCGYGKLIWPDGSTFEGYWINGQACGLGVFRAPTDEIFEGYWQQDRTTNLSVFRQGHPEQLQDEKLLASPTDRQNGKGIEVWSDGSYYLGNFDDGVKQGLGVYYWADGSKYSGEWQNDEMSGPGSFQWADGRHFEGDFKSGVMHGFGIYKWQDGRKYEGNYRFNKKHGEGTYTYSDGSKYRGEWVDGLQHGVGSIIDAESACERKGVWAGGRLKQWLKFE